MVTRREILATGAGAAFVAMLPRIAHASDSEGPPLPSGTILATSSYRANAVVKAGLKYVEIPQTVVTFDAPASGRVVVACSGAVSMLKTGYQGYFKIGGVESLVMIQNSILRVSSRVVVEGLSGPQTLTLSIRSNADPFPIQLFSGDIAGTSYGPLTVAVMAA